MSGTTESSKRIKAAIAGEPTRLLELAGFQKKGHHFYKVLDNSTIHVGFQADRLNTPGHASFTANVWSYHPAIASAQGEKPIADPTKQRFAHSGMRIGHLLPQQQDYWWVIASATEVNSVANEVAIALEKFGLPYLEQIATLEGVAEFSGLIPGMGRLPNSARATALALLGRDSEANAELKAISEGSRICRIDSKESA